MNLKERYERLIGCDLQETAMFYLYIVSQYSTERTESYKHLVRIAGSIRIFGYHKSRTVASLIISAYDSGRRDISERSDIKSI
jgi:hypothetical protein